MEIIVVRDGAEWNRRLAGVPGAHVLQTWEWGEIKSRHGWTPLRVLYYERDTVVAAAQVLRRPLPRTPWGVLYVPKGPALDNNDAARSEAVFSALQRLARQQRAIFIKVDPDILPGQAAARALEHGGWRVSTEQIQFRNTVALDLSPTEEELLAAMKPKWRYNIRLAERRGVRVARGGEDDLARFYELYAETSARDHFLIRAFPYYRDVWSTMLRGGLAELLLARAGGELLAGIMLFRFAGRAWYLYGASRSEHRDLMPNHLLQWEAIRCAKAQGCREYDFWGAPDRLAEEDPMYGVYKFKTGFGGRFVERIPAHDYVVNAPLYWLYAVARPRYLARLRGQQSKQPGE